MADGTLTIGTRQYSSWSLRGWLLVRLGGLDVAEVVIRLSGGGTTAAVKRVSASGLVPLLEHRGTLVWETLAIAEYVAEHTPGIWPEGLAARAWARSIAAEMHAGFRALRAALPMNLKADRPGVGSTPEVRADIDRIEAIWTTTREKFGAGGPFLFGRDFGAADAMYAPVVARFLSYHPALSAGSRAYCDAVRAHPLVEEWYRGAFAEPEDWRVPVYENVT